MKHTHRESEKMQAFCLIRFFFQLGFCLLVCLSLNEKNSDFYLKKIKQQGILMKEARIMTFYFRIQEKKDVTFLLDHIKMKMIFINVTKEMFVF